MQRKIYTLGDIHGAFRVIPQLIISHGLQSSIIIQVGDFGVGFLGEKRDLENLETLNQILEGNDIIMYVIRGNHDFPKFFTGEYMFSNLKLLPDFSFLELGGYNFLFVGGAISIDRTYRTENIDYWKEEGFKLDLHKLSNIPEIDVVITHSAPDQFEPYGVDAPIVNKFAANDKTLKTELLKERAEHGTLLAGLCGMHSRPKLWVYGHFHDSYTGTISDVKYRGLDINELYEIKL